MTLRALVSAGPSLTEGLRSSGTSPGSKSLHLVGPGKVGRQLLRELFTPPFPVRLVAVSDRSATVFDRAGLRTECLADHKERGAPLSLLDGAQAVPLDLALGLVRADFVVDACDTRLDRSEDALRRVQAALRSGSRVALASKAALAVAADELLATGRVGANAALGGTGARLLRELPDLSRSCTEVALVANASTTALVEAFERGEDRAEALRALSARGVLEPDPAADLDGTDLALKLAIVARAVFGLAPAVADIPREGLQALDPALAWWRAQRGRTTRLVARATRAGELSVALEELPRSSPLAVPSDRVAYVYGLGGGASRAHIGWGIGPRGTARALLADVAALTAQANRGGAS